MELLVKQVSVIIPIYNAAFFIEKAVDSVLTHSSVGEIILVEDGSSDNSYEVCVKLLKQDDRIVLLSHPKRVNKGAAISRNVGIKNSKFPLISFLDSDDVYYANRFLEAINVLHSNSEIDACFGNVEMINIQSGQRKLIGILKMGSKSSLLTYLLNGGYFHTNSLTVKKSFFDRVGYFDQTSWPHEDSELWIRMAAHGQIVPISDKSPIASYAIHENNLSKVASFQSKRKMWLNVYAKVFHLPIGLFNRLLIFKQLIKFNIKSLIN